MSKKTLAKQMRESIKRKALELWKYPANYMGTEYFDYYVGPSVTRDSDIMEQSNFNVALDRLGGENEPDVIVARASHWAVGWVDTIYVHKDAADKVKILESIENSLENYPVLDDDNYSELQMDNLAESWDSWMLNEAKDLLGIDERDDVDLTEDQKDKLYSVLFEYECFDLDRNALIGECVEENKADILIEIGVPPKSDADASQEEIDELQRKFDLTQAEEHGQMRLFSREREKSGKENIVRKVTGAYKEAYDTIDYTPELDKRIKNLDSLPRGLSAPYLVVIKGQGDDLVAKEWKRTLPKNLEENEILIRLRKANTASQKTPVVVLFSKVSGRVGSVRIDAKDEEDLLWQMHNELAKQCNCGKKAEILLEEAIKKFAGSSEARELFLHIAFNDRVRQLLVPVYKNYQKKREKGVYDPELAVKGLLYITIAAAKDYTAEYSSSESLYTQVFDKDMLTQVAKSLARFFEEHYETESDIFDDNKWDDFYSTPIFARKAESEEENNFQAGWYLVGMPKDSGSDEIWRIELSLDDTEVFFSPGVVRDHSFLQVFENDASGVGKKILSALDNGDLTEIVGADKDRIISHIELWYKKEVGVAVNYDEVLVYKINLAEVEKEASVNKDTDPEDFDMEKDSGLSATAITKKADTSTFKPGDTVKVDIKKVRDYDSAEPYLNLLRRDIRRGGGTVSVVSVRGDLVEVSGLASAFTGVLGGIWVPAFACTLVTPEAGTAETENTSMFSANRKKAFGLTADWNEFEYELSDALSNLQTVYEFLYETESVNEKEGVVRVFFEGYTILGDLYLSAKQEWRCFTWHILDSNDAEVGELSCSTGTIDDALQVLQYTLDEILDIELAGHTKKATHSATVSAVKDLPKDLRERLLNIPLPSLDSGAKDPDERQVEFKNAGDVIEVFIAGGDLVDIIKPGESEFSDAKGLFKRKSGAGNDVDVYSANPDDLDLIIQNDRKLYDGMVSVFKTLTKFKKENRFDPVLAKRLFKRIVDEAANNWVWATKSWLGGKPGVILPPTQRVKDQTCEDLVKFFESEYEAQSYDFMRSAELEKRGDLDEVELSKLFKKSINKLFRENQIDLKTELLYAIKEACANFKDYEFEPGRAIYGFEVLAVGGFGDSMFSTMLDGFGLPRDEENDGEFDAEICEDFAEAVAEEANKRFTNVLNIPGYSASIISGYNEGDGSLELQLLLERGEDEEFYGPNGDFLPDSENPENLEEVELRERAKERMLSEELGQQRLFESSDKGGILVKELAAELVRENSDSIKSALSRTISSTLVHFKDYEFETGRALYKFETLSISSLSDRLFLAMLDAFGLSREEENVFDVDLATCADFAEAIAEEINKQFAPLLNIPGYSATVISRYKAGNSYFELKLLLERGDDAESSNLDDFAYVHLLDGESGD
jgi:hypothetical protein